MTYSEVTGLRSFGRRFTRRCLINGLSHDGTRAAGPDEPDQGRYEVLKQDGQLLMEEGYQASEIEEMPGI